MNSFLLSFIPLFVAIDALGTLPLFMGLTENFTRAQKRKLAFQAVLTALGVGMTFGTAGSHVFALLGITQADFQIAGGLLLVVLSIREIYGDTAKNPGAPAADNFIGFVPLGVPLIAGPAMITTLLILHEEHSYFSILGALVANLIIAWVLLIFSDRILKTIGDATAKVFAKIVAIFLAAIGIMMIRRGLETFLLQ